MNIRSFWRSPPNGDAVNTSIAFARNLEERERRSVSSVKLARTRLAGKLRIGVGTLENLVRGRVKRIDAVVRDRLHALMVHELEQEIARLTHELELARQGGAHLASIHVGEIETYLAKARALLKGEA